MNTIVMVFLIVALSMMLIEGIMLYRMGAIFISRNGIWIPRFARIVLIGDPILWGLIGVGIFALIN